jgi:hypothetical protein
LPGLIPTLINMQNGGLRAPAPPIVASPILPAKLEIYRRKPAKNSSGWLRDSVTRFFAAGFFHESVYPQPQSIPKGPFRIFFENLRRYSQVKVHHRYQRHRWQILPPVWLVLLIPVANLPPVSTTPV